MKTLVYSVYLVEVVQTIFVTHDAFEEYAKGFGNLKALEAEDLHWIAVPVFSGIGKHRFHQVSRHMLTRDDSECDGADALRLPRQHPLGFKSTRPVHLCGTSRKR